MTSEDSALDPVAVISRAVDVSGRVRLSLAALALVPYFVPSPRPPPFTTHSAPLASSRPRPDASLASRSRPSHTPTRHPLAIHPRDLSLPAPHHGPAAERVDRHDHRDDPLCDVAHPEPARDAAVACEERAVDCSCCLEVPSSLAF